MEHCAVSQHGKVKRCSVERYKLRIKFGNSTNERAYQFSFRALTDMRCTKRIDYPLIIIAMRDQCANTDYRVVQVFGKLVANCCANFFVTLAVMTVSSSKSFYVRNSLKIPDENMGRHGTCLKFDRNDAIFSQYGVK